ncbi:MAG: DUF368 domain-containing protein [Flavobacteriaceae bacterium]|nr:DUF368 domain-containing protein [Flavobacteriaceae bacterium]
MPSRNILQYLIITLKGLAMGAADVVPGVSGGTIAFISGIYEELIDTIHQLDFNFFKKWKSEGFLNTWKAYNLSFLLALFFGIAISIISFAKIISVLLKEHPILVWSFFFGLVIASILYVGKQINKWSLPIWISIALATSLSYYITLAEPIGSPDSTWFLFFAGFVAIIAMILPGISGAFILLLLGAYQSVLDTINQLRDGITTLDWKLFSDAFLKVAVFGLGAIFGIKIFSKALNWMFSHHKNIILAILTGFMIGALNKIWPWKEVLQFRINSHGEEVPFLEKSILPSSYSEEPLVLYAILFMVIGFLMIFILERLSVHKKDVND